MMTTFAPIITRVAPTDTNPVDVFSGGRVKILGFIVSNTSGSAATATIRTNEASPTTLFTVRLPLNFSFSVPIPWIADKGIEVIDETGNVIVFSFLHTQEGS